MTTKAPLPTDLAGVLHDVSNSLTVVLGWAEEASHASASRETIDAALRIIVAEARRGRTLARSAIGGDDAGLSGTIEAVVASVANGCVIEARRRGVTVRVDARAKGAVARALELEHVL